MVAKIWDSKLRQQVVNVSEAWPEFFIRGLTPGHNYTATVTAYNSRGSAPAAPVDILTVNEAQMHKSKRNAEGNNVLLSPETGENF